MSQFDILGLIRNRLDKLSDAIKNLNTGLSIPALNWINRAFKGSLHGHNYANIKVRKVRNGSEDTYVTYDHNQGQYFFNITDNVIKMFDHFLDTYTSISDAALENLVDNFILHEVFHNSQGMRYGLHRGMGRKHPNILSELDWEADGLAIVTMLALYLDDEYKAKNIGLSNRNDLTALWEKAGEFIIANIRQIHLFHAVNEKPSGEIMFLGEDEYLIKNVSPSRWSRMAGWHFQYCRSLNFNRCVSVGNLFLHRRVIIDMNFLSEISNNGFLHSKWLDDSACGGNFRDYEFAYTYIGEHATNSVINNMVFKDELTISRLGRGIFSANMNDTTYAFSQICSRGRAPSDLIGDHILHSSPGSIKLSSSQDLDRMLIPNALFDRSKALSELTSSEYDFLNDRADLTSVMLSTYQSTDDLLCKVVTDKVAIREGFLD